MSNFLNLFWIKKFTCFLFFFWYNTYFEFKIGNNFSKINKLILLFPIKYSILCNVFSWKVPFQPIHLPYLIQRPDEILYMDYFAQDICIPHILITPGIVLSFNDCSRLNYFVSFFTWFDYDVKVFFN